MRNVVTVCDGINNPFLQLSYGIIIFGPKQGNLKVIEKCTNFYSETEKLPLEVLRIDQYCEKSLGMLVTKSFFSVRFGVTALPSLLLYR